MFPVAIAVLLFTLTHADPIRTRRSPDPNDLIVGGGPTRIEDHPWQVSILVQNMHFCGGSIISESFILTAAHCSIYRVDQITVRVGSAVLLSGGSVHKVAAIIRHQNYSYNAYGVPLNDLALLELETPIERNDKAKPIPLFDQDEETIGGTITNVSGWGATMENGDKSRQLRSVEVPIVDKADCQRAYRDIYGGIPEGQICAGTPEGGKDTCQADSGGPLVIDGRQAGIVSWGNGCARRGYPGVYTEVAHFRNWLAQHAGV